MNEERIAAVDEQFRVRCEPDPGFLARHRRRREALSPVAGWTFRELGFRLAAATVAVFVLLVFLAPPGSDPVSDLGPPPIFAFEAATFEPPALPGMEADGDGEPVLRIAIGTSR